MYIPFLHLLDRNAVSLIKESNAGKIQTDATEIGFLQKLRRLDRKQDYVSPLLSIIEDEHGRADTVEEKMAAQRKESDAVRHFFKSAQTDSDFLDSNSDLFGKTFTEYWEGGWAARGAFLAAAARLIASAVKQDQRTAVEHQLVALSRESGLSQPDPLLVLCIACLYGSDDARSVIKPMKLNAYNVLNDLHVLSRLGLVQAVVRDRGVPLRVRVASRDRGLVGVLSHIGLTTCELSVEGDLWMTLRYGPGLFPALSSDHYQDLLDRITPVADESGIPKQQPFRAQSKQIVVNTDAVVS